MNAGREHRHDQLAFGAGEDFLEGVDDIELRPGVAPTVDVGAVAEHAHDTLAAELRQTVEVDVLAVEGRLVDLEIARMEERPGWRVQRDRDAVRHAVRDADELDVGRADRHAVSRLYRHEPIAGVDAVLGELWGGKGQREGRAVDASPDVGPHIGNRADMVLVPVRQHERVHPTDLLQVRQVRNDQVDAEQVGLGEHHARIDEQARTRARNRHHVHAELAQAPQGDGFEHRRRFGRLRRHTCSRYGSDDVGTRRIAVQIGSRSMASIGRVSWGAGTGAPLAPEQPGERRMPRYRHRNRHRAAGTARNLGGIVAAKL